MRINSNQNVYRQSASEQTVAASKNQSSRVQQEPELPRSSFSQARPTQSGIAGFLGRISRAPISSFGAAIGAAAITPSLLVMAPGAQAVEHIASRPNFQPRVEAPRYSIASSRTNEAPFYERTFAKMDSNRDGRIRHSEIVDYMKSLNIDGGLFGLVHSKGAEAILDNVDQNSSGAITKDEMMRIAGAIKGTEEFFNPETAPAAFRSLDRNNDGKVTVSEMSAGIESRLKDDVSFKSTIAESAGKMVVDIFDANGDKKVSSSEMSRAAREADIIRRHFP